MLSVSLVIWKALRTQSAAEILGGRYPQRMPCSWYPCEVQSGGSVPQGEVRPSAPCVQGEGPASLPAPGDGSCPLTLGTWWMLSSRGSFRLSIAPSGPRLRGTVPHIPALGMAPGMVGMWLRRGDGSALRMGGLGDTSAGGVVVSNAVVPKAWMLGMEGGTPCSWHGASWGPALPLIWGQGWGMWGSPRLLFPHQTSGNIQHLPSLQCSSAPCLHHGAVE